MIASYFIKALWQEGFCQAQTFLWIGFLSVCVSVCVSVCLSVCLTV